ncbi:helix-turn-helix domain-containing protein [Streptomyces europaeiscabiei]|uniref:helix-turn-helix domain-containing protein n=1 Tax=Streptomyces europaeiscabiei TaxID=146819 RepID=UPI0038F78B7F
MNARGGGLTDAGRALRERIRLQAVNRFEGGESNRKIAAALRVSERSVERWRQQWPEHGEAGVLSKGSPGCPRLSGKLLRASGHVRCLQQLRTAPGALSSCTATTMFTRPDSHFRSHRTQDR